MTINLEPIAKAKAFSVPTVSRALSNPDYPPSAATRQRITEVAHEMGCGPNLTARHLRTDQSNTVGIIVDDILSPFVPQILMRSKSMGSHSFEKPAMQTRLSEPRIMIRPLNERG